jgi:hypothetical protein
MLSAQCLLAVAYECAQFGGSGRAGSTCLKDQDELFPRTQSVDRDRSLQMILGYENSPCLTLGLLELAEDP